MPLRFPTAETAYQAHPSKSRPDKAAEWPLAWYWFERHPEGHPLAGRLVLDAVGDQLIPRRREGMPLGDARKSADPALVTLDHGRWLVHCPGPTCSSAQYASWDDRRFYCVECDNAHVGGKWLPVVWPDEPEAIEAVMLARPAEHRLMAPGETLADLRDENVAQGFPPADGEAALTGKAREAAIDRWRAKRVAGVDVTMTEAQFIRHLKGED